MPLTLAGALLLGAMTTSEAIMTILNGAGAVPPARYAEAVARVKADAEAGKPVQQYVYATTLSDEVQARRYYDAARPRIRALAEKRDNPLAWYLLSVEKNDYKLLRRAADGGNVQAMNALGTIQISSVCADKNISTNEIVSALSSCYGYFRKAVEKGDVNALINLGTCYLHGYGCAFDLKKAHACFALAAKKGHPEAMDCLSACYELGHGVEVDTEKSLYWRMKARAIRGDAAAEAWLRSH